MPLRPEIRCAFALLLLAPALTACSETATATGAGYAVRDSAGIRITDSGSGSWTETEAWQISPEPTVMIGMANGPAEYLLSRVRDVQRLADGRLILVDGGSSELRIFDADGRFEQTIGRSGEGPGEFRWPEWIRVLPGDSLLVYDSQLQRVSLFSPDHRHIRSTNLGEAGKPIGAFADGTLLVEIVEDGEEMELGLVRDPLLFVRSSQGGEILDSLARTPGRERVQLDAGPFVLIVHRLYGLATTGIAGDGRAYLGSNDSYEIRRYTPEGRLETILRHVAATRAIPREAVAARQQAMSMTMGEDATLQQALRDAFAQMPIPETLPAFASFLLDDEGNLWVGDMRLLDTDPSTWRIFDHEDRFLGTVELPGGFMPKHIGNDFVLGVWQGELGLEQVRMYSLNKTEDGRRRM